MANTSCELVWTKRLLNELGVHHDGLMTLHCDNQAAMHIAKNQRTNISSRGNCDFISRLPDPILYRILGLLNTKKAVQTCVLSKRWEHLWTSLSSLNFEWNELHARFGKFVNTFLLRRKPLVLDVFRLSCFMFRSTYAWEVSDWIRYAVNHNTRVLHLKLGNSVPCCIYTCTSLEELYLYFVRIDSSIPIVNLPNLRKLSINGTGLDSSYVENLLSGCTKLEFLRLESCYFSECIISHECLKQLAIKNCWIRGSRLFINAPNLLSFSYTGKLSKATLSMPSLRFVCLVCCDFSTYSSMEDMVTFFRFLTNVELLELHLECCWDKDLSAAVWPLELSIFAKLKNVTIGFCMFSCFQMVTSILKCSPNLTKLTILQQKEECLYHVDEDEEEASTKVPPNISSTIVVSPCKKLEIVEVKYSRYNKKVRGLVDGLMDGTKELENLKIHLSKYQNNIKRSEN
ncbi:putative F-box/LRR-repeat protein At4g15060 [Carex rostrata]